MSMEPEPPRRGREAFVGDRPGAVEWSCLVLVCLPLFVGLSETLHGSEPRFTLITRGMVESGNWLEPVLRGRFYGDKPLLSYWAIATAALARGGLDEVAARLPSVLAAVGTVLLTGWMGARLLGRKWAVPAGVVLATSYGFVLWMREASADPLNLLFIVAAIAIYLEWCVQPARWMIPAFLVSIAIGAHAKGSPAFLVPLAVVGVDVLVQRRWEILRELPRVALWLPLAVALYAVPFVASYFVRGDWGLFDLMWKENFVRALDAFDHRAPVWYYTWIVPVNMAPWTPWLPGALVVAASAWRRHAGARFALLASGTIFVLFTASESRRSYYILPVFPLLALVVVASWDVALRALRAGFERTRLWRASLDVPAGLLAGVVGSLGVALLIGRFAHPNLASIIGALRGAALAGTAFVLLAGAIALAIARGRPERVIVASLAAGLAIALLVTASIGALREGRRQERPLAAKLRALAQDERLLFYFRAHGALLWYVGGDGARTTPNQPSHLLRLLPEADDRALVACGSSRCWDGDLAPQLACEPVLEAVAPPLGEWIAADPQYRVFRCVRRDPPG